MQCEYGNFAVGVCLREGPARLSGAFPFPTGPGATAGLREDVEDA